MSQLRVWEGKVVLVTGGAKGIGAVIVEQFAIAGARVVINCFHSYVQGKELAARLNAEGCDVAVRRGSVAKPEQVQNLLTWIDAEYGRLDVLVNNAAFGVFKDSETTTPEDLRRSFEVNVTGALTAAQASRALLADSRGCIVNLSSVGAGHTVGNYTSVGTTKAGVESLTRYLAAEWAQYGIRVNCASGGLIAGGVADVFPEADSMQEVVAQATPWGTLGAAADIANVVEFLASPRARWITGQVLLADGGMSLGAAMLTPSEQWSRSVDAARQQGGQIVGPGGQAGNDNVEGERDQTELISDNAQEPPRRSVTELLSQPDTSTQGERTVDENEVIVVVGMGMVVPGASSPEEFWRVLEEGPELLNQERPERIRSHHFYDADQSAEDKTYQISSGFSDDYHPDAELQSELGEDRRATDYTTQWFRHALRQALASVRLRGKVSCAIGYTADGNQHLEEALVVESLIEDLNAVLLEQGHESMDPQVIRTMLSESYPLYARSGRAPLPFEVGHDAIAGLLGDNPEVSMVDTACSSSLYALDIAVKGLLDGTRDTAVCGGTFSVGPRNAVLFAKLHGLSPSGQLRPLDERADGVLFADGAATVVLKRLKDARADGDPILGYISGVGMSSDGKGKAIYAPNVKGQKLAIKRASDQRTTGEAPDWVVAHATGTPAGDLCEITSVRESMTSGNRTWVTSNKSLVGHTGWAAGVVSLIQVLLSFRHQVILPQHRFDRALPAYELESSSLAVPMEPIPWPTGSGVRTAAVSGFGFGGTNAHLVVQDVPVAFGREAHSDDIVLVGWAADVPGLKSPDEVESWIRRGGKINATFGDVYDTSDLGVRMPPKVLRTLDRAQLMALRCASDLRNQLGVGTWQSVHERIGVFIGSMGPTRNASMYARRCHLGATLDALASHDPRLAEGIREPLTARVRSGVVASNEDSFPGIMPNIVSARISNVFDTNGPNMVLDTGVGSALTSLDVAADYLRTGEIDVAVAGGINGNSTPTFERIARETLGQQVDLHEGAFLFTLMRRSTARELGAPVLATVGELKHENAQAVLSRTDHEARPQAFFGGAHGGLAVLSNLLQTTGSSAVAVSNGPRYPGLTLDLNVGETQHQEKTQEDGLQSPVVSRHDRIWTPAPLSDNAGRAAELPPRVASVVFNADRGTGRGIELPDVPVVYVADLLNHTSEAVELSSEGVLQVLQGLNLEHVRCMVDLRELSPDGDPTPQQARLLDAVHDVLFLAAKRQAETVAQGGTFAIALLGSWNGKTAHPMTGVFTGFAKSLALEGRSRGLEVRAVLTQERDPKSAMALLDTELEHPPGGLPTAAWANGQRFRESAVETTRPEGTEKPLNESSVVLATAGGKGITARVVVAVAKKYRCHMYLMGSTNLEQCRKALDSYGGIQALADKSAFIRAVRNRRPDAKVALINAEYERLQGAAEIMQTLAQIDSAAGAGKGHYLQADVTDRDQVNAAVSHVQEGHDAVDLVIHGAGINRASTVITKSLTQFRAVREVKIGGYFNLRSALRASFGEFPRMWCSFSSLIGLTGQQGETDYASANDALASLAQAHRAEGQDEFAIGWTLWKDAGMAASSVHQSFFSGVMGDVLSLMSTSEGVHKFLEELDAGARTGAVVHIGDVEQRSIEEAAPGFFSELDDRNTGSPSDPGRGLFYVDQAEWISCDEVICHRLIDQRDSFLSGHSVGGIGTLPGCFVLELMAEASRVLRPDLVMTGARDVRFHSFLRTDGPATRTPLQLRTTVLASTEESTLVEVRISVPLVTPSGRALHRDKVFFTGQAVLEGSYPPALLHSVWPEAKESPVLDPYHGDGAPVALTQEFVTTARTRLHPLGKRATYRGAVRPNGTYDGFLKPVLMMDGLIRLAVLEEFDQPVLPVAAPTRIGRVDFYAPDNDVALSSERGSVELYATPRGVGLDDSAVYTAVGPDGRVLLTVSGLEGVVIGHVDAHTGGAVADPAQSITPRQESAERIAL